MISDRRTHTEGARRRANCRAALAFCVAGLPVLAGCSGGGSPAASGSAADTSQRMESSLPRLIAGATLSASPTPAVESSRAPSATAPAVTDACTLLTGADFKQPGSPPEPKRDHLDGWDSVCKWATLQSRPGYSPPPDVNRSDHGPGAGGDLAAAGESADKLAETLENSVWVIVHVVVSASPEPPRPQASSYTQGGRRFEVSPGGADRPDSCVAATAWGQGTAMVAITDPTRVVKPCDTAKRLIGLVAAKAPS